MSVSSVASSYSPNIVAPRNEVQSAGRRDRDGDGDGGGGRRIGGAGGAGGGFAQAVMQALAQSGLAGNTPSARGTSGTKDADGASEGSGDASSTGQALSAFMHTLFQAMRSAGDTQGTAPDSAAANDLSASASAAPPARSGYGNPASDLESLLRKLGAGSDVQGGSPGGTVDDLKSAFEKLVSALGADGTDGTSSQGSAPDLRAFLQNLQKDLPSEGGSRLPPPTGSMFRASA